MTPAWRILRYQLADVRRSRAVLAYGALLFVLTEALLRFGGGGPRAIASLMNLVLVFVPLVSLVFGTMYLYGAREFVELLLAQPVRRRSLYAGIFAGLTVPLAGALIAGVALPFAWHRSPGALAGPLTTLLGAGVLLTVVFTGLAFVLTSHFDDRARGLGAGLLIWLATTVAWDGLVLLVVVSFGDYPLEKPLLVLSLLNPVDTARIALLLQLDNAALLGYTGAVFERFFGSAAGIAVTTATLLVWSAVPAWLGWRKFRKRDW